MRHATRLSGGPLGLILGLALLAGQAAGAQDFDKVEIRRTDLGDGLAMLEGAGGNIGVSTGPDGVVLVDDQYAPLTEKIRAAVAEMTDGPIRFVINTHWHADHTGGNEKLGRSGAVIIAHHAVRRRMSVEQVMRALGRKVPAAPQEALPVVTFGEGVTLHLNGDEIELSAAGPAHTDGDLIVHWKGANLFHMGDTFVNGAYPFVDLDSGGDVDGILSSTRRVLALSDAATRIIPGHGPLADREDLQGFVDMLATVRGRIAKQIEKGRSLDEVLAANPTADYDEAWGQGFMSPARFTRFVYQSLRASSRQAPGATP